VFVAVPAQAPFEVERVSPTSVVPEMEGAAVAQGAVVSHSAVPALDLDPLTAFTVAV
jgi:hypothetical protein